MFTKINSAAVLGLNCEPITVEVNLGKGFPGFNIIGLADTAIRGGDLDEARALEAKRAAEDAIKNRTADIDYAAAQAELAEAIAQLRAIQQIRHKHPH